MNSLNRHSRRVSRRASYGMKPPISARRLDRALATLLLALPFLVAPTALGAQLARYDVLLKGGTVVDGSGGAPFVADVAISGGTIVRVSRDPIAPSNGLRVIDARGLVVAPGFVDSHDHTQDIASSPLAENFLRQGVTTVVASLHSGDLPWPLAEHAASLRIAPNIGFFAGHGWIRKRVLGLDNRAPTAAELAHMTALVDSAMRQGALGLSSGLEYLPGTFAKTDELVAMARVVKPYGGSYVTHMRDEGSELLASIREVIAIAQGAGVSAQIHHIKSSGAANFGGSVRALALIDSARAAGLDLAFDLYPYTAFNTYGDLLLPSWALEGGRDAFVARMRDPAQRAKAESEMGRIFREQAGRDLTSIQFSSIPQAPEYAGRTLADYARDRGKPNTIEAGIPLIVDLMIAGRFTAIYHAMDEADVRRFLAHPAAMVESDGDLVGYGVGFPHPRAYGSFPRVLARYVRDEKLLTLPVAIAKMTRMPAERIGQMDLGLVREGMRADLTVFNADQVRDLSTFTEPHHYAAGIVHVIVNGVTVILGGALTGSLPGRVLTRAGISIAAANRAAPGAKPPMSLDSIRGRVRDWQKIANREGIDTLVAIPVNGSTQWVSVRGRNRANPVIVMFHGGPGSALMGASWSFQWPWEDHFTVVQWEQRGVGKNFVTADTAALRPTMTGEQHVKDAEVVVNWVRQTLHKKKVVVMGVSWGTLIGAMLAQKHPELLNAYVGVGQGVADADEKVGYLRTLQIATLRRDTAALRELKSIAPYPAANGNITLDQAITMRRWARKYDGGWYGHPDFRLYFTLPEWSSAYSDAEFDGYFAGVRWAGEVMIGGPSKFDLHDVGRVYRTPMLVLEGRHDLHTPWASAQAWTGWIQSPRTRFITFERSGHFPFLEEPGRFLEVLLKEVLPLTEGTATFTRDP